MKIIMCSNAAGLQEALRGFNSATVEAEYGDTCVPGSVVTLAHHGPRRNNPSPCIGDNMPNGYLCEGGRYCAHGSDSAHWVDVEVVGVSHFDLDTLGGVLRVLGRKPNDPNFWAAAGAVDIRGPHTLGAILEEVADAAHDTWVESPTPGAAREGLKKAIERKLNAFWSWSEENRLLPDREGKATEVGQYFAEAERILNLILNGDEELTAKGERWSSLKELLNCNSFQAQKQGVVLRKSESFVNHLYVLPNIGSQACSQCGSYDLCFNAGEDPTCGLISGLVCKAVVAFNTKFKSITVSLADPIPGVSCREIVQTLWGSEAGGHDGIAGSPRGKEMTEADWIAAYEAVIAAVNNK